MGILQKLHRTAATPNTTTTKPEKSQTIWPLLASNALLSALSIVNLGLISSVVAWLLAQKHNVHSYRIDWPANTVELNVEPENLWVDQTYESIGVAAYGFLLGIFGMITAWRLKKAARVCTDQKPLYLWNQLLMYCQPLRSLTALAALQLLAILFTSTALIFVFVATYQTNGDSVREPVASNTVGINYPEFEWTPETWMKAMLDLPLADGAKRDEIDSRVIAMVAWRWMLVPIFIVDCVAFGFTMMAWMKQRRRTAIHVSSANSIEK